MSRIKGQKDLFSKPVGGGFISIHLLSFTRDKREAAVEEKRVAMATTTPVT